MMLSLFPDLLSFEGFAPVLLRLTLGAIFLLWGYKKLKKQSNTVQKSIGALECIIAIALIIGFLTQLAALIAVVILGVKLFKKIQEKAFLTDGVNYYLILFIISLTLLLTGPGLIAFDLPL